MKKVLVVLLLASMAATLLLAGCGESKTDKATADAKAILEKSQEKMADVTGVKITGSTTAQMPEAEQKEAEYDFEAVTQVTPDGETEAHVVASDDGEEIQTYVVGGYAYTHDSNSGWVKQKISGIEDISTAAPTHQQIMEMSRFAENLKMLPDEGDSYVLSFDVGSEFYEQYAEGLTEADTGSTEGGEELDISGMIKDLLKGIKVSVVYKVNKETLYADAAEMEMSMKGVPLMGDMTASIDMVLSDYNKPVSIVLPPEALNAREEELLPGDLDIPSVPGLGF